MKLKKNIFIGGVAKSGKSTFAKKLKGKDSYNHIPLDYFASSLKYNFPETGITSNVLMNKESSEKLALLLSRVIHIIEGTEEKFIIDSAHIMPSDIDKYIDKDKWEIYYLGYPNVNINEKLNIIRKYESQNAWTYKKSDTELLDVLEKLKEISKTIEKECQKLNINFIDTSNM